MELVGRLSLASGTSVLRKPPSYLIKLSNRSFRLMQLLPGAHGSNIECKLIEVTLDDFLVYEAISYVWGSPNDTECIICDDHSITVATSLVQALCRLHLPKRQRLLWAEGICIKQTNVTE